MEDIQIKIKKLLFEALQKSFGSDVEMKVEDIFLERPADTIHGDYSSNIALKLSGALGKNPRQIAELILQNISKPDWVEKLEIAGPGFINIYLKHDVIQNIVPKIIEQMDKYGYSDSKKGKTILIEHTSPNPTKAMHLGHLKNNVTGLSISYLLETTGAKIYRDAIDNNRGISVSRLMWGYLKFARKDGDESKASIEYWFDHQNEWKTPESENVDPGLFVDKLYVMAADDEKANLESEKAIRQLVVDWESEDPKNWALWKLTQDWVWTGYNQVLNRIGGWKFDKIWHESDIYKKGKEHVERGIKEGYFKKLPDGAVVTDFKKDFGITDTILIKSDGTSLYITQDLELTYLKKQEFKADEMNWVIGPEQSLAMKQMFAACSQLGFGNYEDFHHIPYGFILIRGEDGTPDKMSSRKGTQINVSELIDEAKAEIHKFVKDRDFSESEKEVISEKVAIAAIKYSLLKVSRTQDMVFDFKETISFEGNSGPYLLYAYVRMKSILKDINFTLDNLEFKEEEEINLLKHLDKFPEVVAYAANNYAPNAICEYIYELAQKYNRFYNKHSILNADNDEMKNSRLALTAATSQVLKNGLGLLGIETVERM